MVTPAPEQGCVWITGASSGIGRELALRMAAHGWIVAASARREQALEELRHDSGGAVYPYPLDVTDGEAQRATVERIEAELGPIALAVLNAGTHIETLATDIQPDVHRKLIELNYLAVIDGLAALVPRMRERGQGRIAVVASVAGYRGLPSAAGYSASKAAAIAATESYAAELAGTGVSLQVVNPGFIETPLTARNTFPMPMLMPVEKAAEKLEKGLLSRRFEIVFPALFCWIVKLYRCLPYILAMPIARRMRR
ncbi:Short-chain dehydrogenase [Limimonas halophila]|uniref:Short-chain dehydrogenase n=1 Tax=Limimonas halophila TaxID=1082479 RepID=A0A1G7P0V3_9PROT|nr:SDR family NAD(P)-dependent oxidoreductase [Limimonas halophila]SDF79060.1 Short-chain dehydrogenase [Limimonas halophila]